MSGLLVKSVVVMEENLPSSTPTCDRRVPVLLGGAALTRHYAETHLRGLRGARCTTARTRSTGLRICEPSGRGIARGDRRARSRTVSRKRAPRGEAARRSAWRDQMPERRGASGATVSRSPRGRRWRPTSTVPEPPFWGARGRRGVDLDEIYPYINRVALFRGPVGLQEGRAVRRGVPADARGVVHPIFERMKPVPTTGILRPKVVYGLLPLPRGTATTRWCTTRGDHDREIERFTFPRQPARKRLCISDFFRSVESGREADVVGFHCVTMGPEVSEGAPGALREPTSTPSTSTSTAYGRRDGRGAGRAVAQADAGRTGHRPRRLAAQIRDLFTQKYRGSRYSFGYPACPEMSDQEKLFRCSSTRSHRLHADGELADRARASDERDHRASSGGEVLQREEGTEGLIDNDDDPRQGTTMDVGARSLRGSLSRIVVVSPDPPSRCRLFPIPATASYPRPSPVPRARRR